MKKRQYTKEEMLAVCADWQQSGLGRKAYCSQIGLATSTFFYWVKKFKLERECIHTGCTPARAADPAFTELDFSAKDDPAGLVLEIEYPSGTKLKPRHRDFTDS